MISLRIIIPLCALVLCPRVCGLRPHPLSSRGQYRDAAQWNRWTSSSCGTSSLDLGTDRGSQSRKAGNFRKRSIRPGGMTMQMDGDEANKVKMRLRVEAEAPFRKVRIFIFSSFVISATVGLLVSSTRLLALSQGISQGQSFEELLGNVAVDIAAIGISGYVIKRDIAAQDGRLARMEIGAKLAGLKVRLQTADDASTITLSALRRNRGRDKRVAVLVGGADAVRKSLESALPYSSALEKSDILIVPLVLEQPAAGAAAAGSKFRASGGENEFDSAVGRPHVGMPVALNRWQEYIDTEVETAMSQGISPIEDGFSLVLKKNGRIGARSKGCPPWGTLVGDIEKRREAGMDVSNI